MNDEDLSNLISDFVSNELYLIFNENSEMFARSIEEWVHAIADHIESEGIQDEVVAAVVNKCIPLYE